MISYRKFRISAPPPPPHPTSNKRSSCLPKFKISSPGISARSPSPSVMRQQRIYSFRHVKKKCALQHFVGDFARLLHAVHNFMRKYSMIYRCPQIRISDKPSHRGHRPLLFPSSAWVLLTSHTSTVRRGLRFRFVLCFSL